MLNNNNNILTFGLLSRLEQFKDDRIFGAWKSLLINVPIIYHFKCNVTDCIADYITIILNIFDNNHNI
jgi:hypothetical protein